MDFSPRITVDSKRFPGVRYVLKRMSVARRAAFRCSIAEYSAKMRDLYRERWPLAEEHAKAVKAAQEKDQPLEFPEEKLRRLFELQEQEGRLDADEMGPALIRVVFAGIEGFTLKGKPPATADELIAEAPEELTDELADVCNWVAGLSPEQQGNLSWPGTSPTPEAGPPSTTDAMSAGPATTETDPVPSTG